MKILATLVPTVPSRLLVILLRAKNVQLGLLQLKVPIIVCLARLEPLQTLGNLFANLAPLAYTQKLDRVLALPALKD